MKGTPGTPHEADQKQVMPMLEEARMVLPGLQALFGFQLIAFINEGFDKLSGNQKLVHFIALSATLLSAIIVMTPAAYHRIAEKWRASHAFIRVSSRLVAAAMAVFLAGFTLELWLIADLIFRNSAVSLGMAGLVFIIGAGLWFVWPMSQRQQ